MQSGRSCRSCCVALHWSVRSDAIYCSTKCRVATHRNPIPKELRDLPRWVRYSRKKIPLTPDGFAASTTAEKTWSSFDWVVDSTAGIGKGFVFNGDGIIGIDLDSAFDEWGDIKDWALRIVETLPATYCEISPSGRGLHIIGYGQIESGRRWKFEDGGVEVYGSSRFFTITGKRFGKSPLRLKPLGDVVSILEPMVDLLKSK